MTSVRTSDNNQSTEVFAANPELEKFTRSFLETKQMGYIPTHRSGPTGVGKTLEDVLQVQENNLRAPDFGPYELKAFRSGRKCMMTFFTIAPEKVDERIEGSVSTALFDRYSYMSKGKKRLYPTLRMGRNGRQKRHPLYLQMDDNAIYLCSYDSDVPVGVWTKQRLQEEFSKKVLELIMVEAETKGSRENEQFFYTKAYHFPDVPFEGVWQCIREGKMVIEMRLSERADGSLHDHGTGFRITKKNLMEVFASHVIE